jgi:hypothetical protein
MSKTKALKTFGTHLIFPALLILGIGSFGNWLPTALAGTITLDHPVDKYNGVVQFAPLRDFMVQGRLLNFTEPRVNVRITVADAKGNVIRTITSQVNAQGYTDSSQIDISSVGKFGDLQWTSNPQALKNNPSPDLVKDKTISTNKAVINASKLYSAIVFGGIADNSGIQENLIGLTPGDYTLQVAAIDVNGKILDSTSQKIKIDNSNMVCGRFSPAKADGYPHFENVQAFSKTNNLKIMLDPFPAYWMQKPTPISDSVFYENLKIWRVNDLVEYLVAPKTYVVIYNISENSATHGVELGGLIYNKFLEDATPGHSVYFYRYDIGDTSVSYTKKNGKVITKNGAIVDFDGKHRSHSYNQLAMARAEMRNADKPTAENIYNPMDMPTDIDTNLSDGVALNSPQTLSLYGAVTPLANSPVAYDEVKEFYNVGNRIANLYYEITGPGGIITRRETRSIGLTRQYKPNTKAASLYEFKHDFAATDFPHPGVYKIKVQGLDIKGNKVKDANAVFNVKVQ